MDNSQQYAHMCFSYFCSDLTSWKMINDFGTMQTGVCANYGCCELSVFLYQKVCELWVIHCNTETSTMNCTNSTAFSGLWSVFERVVVILPLIPMMSLFIWIWQWVLWEWSKGPSHNMQTYQQCEKKSSSKIQQAKWFLQKFLGQLKNLKNPTIQLKKTWNVWEMFPPSDRE